MNPQLNTHLRQLRLSAMAAALPLRLEQARGGDVDHLEFLELLIQDELSCRADRLYQRRLKQAGIIKIQEFADFDWSFNPKLPKACLLDLARGRFVAEHRNALLIGPPGIGKSHCVAAIAIGAIRAGYRALIRSVFDLAQDFAEAAATDERRPLVERLTKVDLLILEDFGMKKMGPAAAEDLLEIFVRRHEHGATIITTNRPTEDWSQFLCDVPATTAILDRFLAHAEVVQMRGKSYRLHQRARRRQQEMSDDS